MSPLRPRMVVLGLLLLHFAAFLLFGQLSAARFPQWLIGDDIRGYWSHSVALLHGKLPYRDFPLEYPPFALATFAAPQFLRFGGPPVSFPGYVWRFLLENALWSMGIATLLARLTAPPQRPRALLFFLVLNAAAAPMLAWRYDLFPAFLTACAFFCLVKNRAGWAGVFLGLSFAAKLYPLVLVPLFLAFAAIQWGQRSAARLTLTTLGAAALTFAPFLGVSPRVVFSFVLYHAQRGLQIETLPAGLILLARQWGGAQASIVFNFGAFHLVSPAAPIVLKALPIIFILFYALAFMLCVRRFQQEKQTEGAISPQSLAVFSLAALLAFILANKVFSPQYLIWLLPFAPFLRARPAALLLVIFVATTLIFPCTYGSLLDMNPGTILLLNLRNLMLAALFVWLLGTRDADAARVKEQSRMRLTG